jgi:hypothetical protein
LTVTLQVPVPLHGAVQPAKVDPASAVAVSVTVVPAVKFTAHVVPQLIPAGLLVTVPVPVPSLPIDKECWPGGVIVKLAVTAFAALIVMVHVPVPLHDAPLHPAKVDPAAAVAASVTIVSAV